MAIVSFSLFCLRKSSTVRKALLFALCFLSYTSLPCLSTLGTYGLRSCYGPSPAVQMGILSTWIALALGELCFHVGPPQEQPGHQLLIS